MTDRDFVEESKFVMIVAGISLALSVFNVISWLILWHQLNLRGPGL